MPHDGGEPSYIEEDGRTVFERGALPDHAVVPLVIYKGGERIVIGEAVVKGDLVYATITREDVWDQPSPFNQAASSFSLSFSTPNTIEEAIMIPNYKVKENNAP